jgi:hypothetical protein
MTSGVFDGTKADYIMRYHTPRLNDFMEELQEALLEEVYEDALTATEELLRSGNIIKTLINEALRPEAVSAREDD